MASGTQRRALLAALCFAAGLIPVAGRADPADEVARLRQQAEQLRQSLDQLDARIRALEAQQHAGGAASAKDAPGAAPPPAAAAAPAAAASVSSLASLKRNWSEVRAGAAEETVEALLGKPEKVLQIDGNRVWYYAYPGIGQGSVFFNRSGKVTSSQAPSFGWGY